MKLLSAIVAWSLRNRAVVLFATALGVFFGAFSAVKLPIDVVPDITSIQVQVITSAPALSPMEIEQYVTVPVERAMAGIPHSTEVRSVSKYGISVVTIVFTDDTNIYFARQLVSERLAGAQDAIPAHYGKPAMGPITTGLGEVFQFVVRNDALNAMQLQELLNWQIRPQLRTVPGVVDVSLSGGLTRQYEIVLDPGRLNAAHISVTDVFRAVEGSNANVGAGYVVHDGEQVLIGTDGIFASLEDIRRVVVATSPERVPITVASLGDVRFGSQLRRGAATKNGEDEVVLGVTLMLMGENSLAVTEAVKQKLASIQSSLPAGTRIEPSYDRSILVATTIQTVRKNLVEGALLVVAVLLLLLGDMRAGIVVALVIPLSLLFALTMMRAFGISGNLMSLGAIDFGLLVDGAVIIVENTVRRMERRQTELGRLLTAAERIETVEIATMEVRSASVFGEAIIAIVYVPIVTLTGIEGKLFRPMAETVLLALLGAFLLSLTFVPVLASILVRPRRDAQETWLLRKAHALFVPLLGRAMRVRWAIVGAAVLSLAAAVALFARIGAEFTPQLDEGDILVEVRRMPGIALSGSVSSALRIERALRTVPEVVSVASRTGSAELANDPMGIEETDTYVQLKPREAWRAGKTKADLAEELLAKGSEAAPDVALDLSQPIQMRTNEMEVGIKSDVGVMIYGADLDELVALGNHVSRVLRQVPGVNDVWFEQRGQIRYLRITPDREKLARYGLTVDDVNGLTETTSVGRSVGEVLEGDRRFAIVVKTAQDPSGDLESMKSLPLKGTTGQVVPLGDVATIDLRDGPVEINRLNQSRRATVEFNVRGRDMLSTVEQAQAAIARNVTLPTGYRVEWGGQYRHYQDAKARLVVVVPLALSLILFLLWLAFGSLQASALIFLNVPFAVVGGVFALWARGMTFSVSAAVGFIALFGVAVLNGLVLVSFGRHLETEGMSRVEAIQRATELRLRPVLMTAFVAALGFVPMALSTSPGSEVQRPLATVVIGGILSATLLTLFVLPVVYGSFGNAERRRGPPGIALPERSS